MSPAGRQTTFLFPLLPRKHFYIFLLYTKLVFTLLLVLVGQYIFCECISSRLIYCNFFTLSLSLLFPLLREMWDADVMISLLADLSGSAESWVSFQFLPNSSSTAAEFQFPFAMEKDGVFLLFLKLYSSRVSDLDIFILYVFWTE